VTLFISSLVTLFFSLLLTLFFSFLREAIVVCRVEVGAT
jgi:hypothetical protein